MEKENLLRIRGTEALVTLGPSTLSWSFHKKPARRHESISVSIPFNEIITVQKCHIKQEETPENVPDINFTVYHVSRTSSHRWSLKVVTFTAQDTQMAHSWVQAIQKKIIQTGDKRPKKLLVFINPYGGRGKALKIYYTKVSPLFQLVGIESDVFGTTRANYARDYVMEADLQRYDGKPHVDRVYWILHGP